VFPAEHFLRLAGIHDRREIVETTCEVLGDRFAGFGPLDQDCEIVHAPRQRQPQVAILLETSTALQRTLRGVLILPETRISDALFYLVELFFGACGVKDSSAGRSRVARDPRTCEAGRRYLWP